MKKFLFLVLLSGFVIKPTPELDKAQAKAAFVLLNDIRTNPAKYADQFSFLKDVKSVRTLKWNDTLAKVAEARALDLAKRNYFGHVDPDGYGANYYINKEGYKLESNWLSDKKNNFFESLSAGSESGEQAIKALIIDNGTSSLGHRKHLLGMDTWNSSLVDIGIGFVKAEETKYRYYTCVIIAKHKW